MRCIVTAGPTFEPLDQVRRLTNFSTGRLGSELVNHLTDHGHEVVLLIGKQATWRGERRAAQVETFTTTASLRDQFEALSKTNVDAIFHAAAVSDFTFGTVFVRSGSDLVEVQAGKLSTRQGTLLAELRPTPKILAELRTWYPKSLLVGWKYEVDGSRETVLEAARRQIAECASDACVANGPAYGPGFGLVKATGEFQALAPASALFAALEGLLRAC